MISMKDKKGIGTGVAIDDIGIFDVYFYPNEDCTYDDMIKNKKFIAKKFLHQLNKIYQYMEDQ